MHQASGGKLCTWGKQGIVLCAIFSTLALFATAVNVRAEQSSTRDKLDLHAWQQLSDQMNGRHGQQEWLAGRDNWRGPAPHHGRHGSTWAWRGGRDGWNRYARNGFGRDQWNRDGWRQDRFARNGWQRDRFEGHRGFGPGPSFAQRGFGPPPRDGYAGPQRGNRNGGSMPNVVSRLDRIEHQIDVLIREIGDLRRTESPRRSPTPGRQSPR